MHLHRDIGGRGCELDGRLAALLARRLRVKRGPKKSPRPDDGAMHSPRVETAQGV